MNNQKCTHVLVNDIRNRFPSADELNHISKEYSVSIDEYCLYESMTENAYDYRTDYSLRMVLAKGQLLRHKLSVLNRRLQHTRTENKRLRTENQELHARVDDLLERYFI